MGHRQFDNPFAPILKFVCTNVTTSINKMTLLHLAAMYSAGDEDDVRVDVPQLLLAYGADVTLRDSARRMTPLE